MGSWFKGLYWLVILAGIGWLLVRNWERVVAAIRQAWRDFQQLLARLFGGRPGAAPREAPPAATSSGVPPPRFDSFSNPFADASWQRRSARELLQYTFAALEAWGRERNYGRSAEQTPSEYTRHVAEGAPVLRESLRELATLYAHAAWGPRALPAESVSRLRELWRLLEESGVRGQESGVGGG